MLNNLRLGCSRLATVPFFLCPIQLCGQGCVELSFIGPAEKFLLPGAGREPEFYFFARFALKSISSAADTSCKIELERTLSLGISAKISEEAARITQKMGDSIRPI